MSLDATVIRPPDMETRCDDSSFVVNGLCQSSESSLKPCKVPQDSEPQMNGDVKDKDMDVHDYDDHMKASDASPADKPTEVEAGSKLTQVDKTSAKDVGETKDSNTSEMCMSEGAEGGCNSTAEEQGKVCSAERKGEAERGSKANKSAIQVGNSTPKEKGSGKEQAIPPERPTRELRRSARVRPSYAVPSDVEEEEEDDDIKITGEVTKDDESDIEMIEQGDPLAISEDDVQKLKEEASKEPKKDPNVIIIDTNTLIKKQNIARPIGVTVSSASRTAPPSGVTPPTGAPVIPMVTAVSTAAQIQTAIQAFGGMTIPPTLPNAYITAIQQVSKGAAGLLGNVPLEDDGYVIEAPSFIVPYVMEGRPKESIKDFLKSLNEAHEKELLRRKEEEEEVKKKEKGEDVEVKEEESSEQKEGDAVTGDDDKENKSEDKADDAVVETEKKAEDVKHLGRWDSFYKSALGKFFLDLGLSQVQEFIQSDLLRMQKRKLDKMKSTPSKSEICALKALEVQLNASRQRNSHLTVSMKTCKFCSFKTESQLMMERHLESPHMLNYTYKCNFCEFETRGPQAILFHMEAEHNVRGRLEKAPAFFQCPLCIFEDNVKSKMTRHSFSCAKKFRPEKNQDLSDFEPPAKIPKLYRGRPAPVGKTVEGLRMPNLIPKGLSGINLSIQSAIASGLLSATNLPGLMGNRGRGRPIGSYKNVPPSVLGKTSASGSLLYSARPSILQQVPGISSQQQFQLASQAFQAAAAVTAARPAHRILPAVSSASVIPNLSASSSITIQSVQNKGGTTKSPQQPSISITPLPRGGASQAGSPAGNTQKSVANSRPSFVICEICDGYIKDLEQLRNHMNLIHKVKIHPKMIYNRPPLNCQKCQHRFFTDQGLERHLLGTHGLVTSSMQEAANKGKDAGRCPICGKVFQWKLLNHVSRDHKMTLKPAHLSYKCTVCTATFNMYRLFENHVYTAHSVVNKNKDASVSASRKPPNGSDPPLKINDEITIIPQPTTKKAKMADKPVTKTSDAPAMSKEITITKVGAKPSAIKMSHSGVEVISLEDSPARRQAQVNDTPKRKAREMSAVKRVKT